MTRRFHPPRSRPRSPTAKALEILRLTNGPKAKLGRLALRGQITELPASRRANLRAAVADLPSDPGWPPLDRQRGHWCA